MQSLIWIFRHITSWIGMSPVGTNVLCCCRGMANW